LIAALLVKPVDAERVSKSVSLINFPSFPEVAFHPEARAAPPPP
jgi:hypothetical protein